jgi:hypothetical protein
MSTIGSRNLIIRQYYRVQFHYIKRPLGFANDVHLLQKDINDAIYYKGLLS